MQPPSSGSELFDGLAAALNSDTNIPAATHRVSLARNKVRIISMQGHFGCTNLASKEIATAAAQQVTDLTQAITAIISQGRAKIDILSLDPPEETGPFADAICDGLAPVFAAASQEHPVLVRLLWGYTPLNTFSYDRVRSPFGTFSNTLMKFIDDNGWTPKIADNSICIYIGQYKWTFTWNHSKIVAADGCQALVGGHNFYPLDYGSYPPVNDVSAHVSGPAAAHAHEFADYLWQQGGRAMWVTKVEPSRIYEVGALSTHRIFASAARNAAVVRCGPGAGIVPVLRTVYPDIQDQQDAKTLSLGRLGKALQPNQAHDASHFAKEWIIKNAQTSLKISQQDLTWIMRGFFSEADEQVCDWIAEALIANKDLRVYIVVSPIHAAGRNPYSWGAGAIGTRQMITRRIQAHAPEAAVQKSCANRLFVAPYCFTDVTFTREGGTSTTGGYVWPGNNPKPTGAILNYPSAPGHHDKVYVADNEVLYIGSDNFYPGALSEFGYLYVGDDLVQTYLSDYWNPMWQYSQQHCVSNTATYADTTATEAEATESTFKAFEADFSEITDLTAEFEEYKQQNPETDITDS